MLQSTNPQPATTASNEFFSVWGGNEIRDLALLCLLAVLSYLPTLRFSVNPLIFDAGLTSASQRGAFPGLTTIDPNAGTTTQGLGKLSADYWLQGNVPWWNPYAGVGLPLAAEIQPSSLFFPFILLLHFSNGLLYLKIALQMLAGAATYAFLRQLGIGRFAAFTGASLYEFNGTFAWLEHAPIMPVPFLPVLLLGIERAFVFAGQKRRGGWALVAIGIAYSLYAGFPESAYLNGLFALFWSLLRWTMLDKQNRWAFAGKVISGGCTALLLAAPILITFFEYLQLSPIGHGGFNERALPESGLALWVIPYILGPIEAFSGLDPTLQIVVNWGNIGGYLQTGLLFLASLAVLNAKKEKRLRFGLAVWMIIFITRIFSVSGIAVLTKLIPGSDLIAMFRYSEPSIELAGATLAAFALNDWRRTGKTPFVRVLAAFAVTVVFGFVAFRYAKPLIHLLAHTGAKTVFYKYWLRGWLAWTIWVLGSAALLCGLRYSRKRAVLLTTLLAADAMILCAFPVFSGARKVKIDMGPIAFLRQHLGLQRFYTMGPIHANYASYFQIASINHNYLPVADNWVQYIYSTLDPVIKKAPVDFFGDYPPPLEEREEAFRAHLHGFEATAVRYVVTNPERNPFVYRVAIPHSEARNTPRPLKNGERFSGVLLSPLLKSGSVAGLDLTIGTYGKTTGFLQAELCQMAACVEGRAPLEEAVDNAPLKIMFNHPLPITAGEPLQYTFTHTGGDLPVAIWTWPTTDAKGGTPAVGGNRPFHDEPEISLAYAFGPLQPRLVYKDRIANIFELPNPSPYFEASGTCELSQASRESLKVSCRAPAVLIRRELMYPGWRAFINGKETPLTQSASIFQTINLPKGESTVVFRYEPSHIRWAYAAALLGLVWLLTEFWRHTRSLHRETKGTSVWF